ncbi:MAG: molybdate ABC transporter permease subunit [Panacagrimonas sp.]
MSLSAADLLALWLSVKLAAVVTALLLLLCVPLAWWLAKGRNRGRNIVASLVSLPLVLPPTVLGFYLLIALGPHSPVGQLTQDLGIGLLAFSFEGLVIASMIYSLPFVVQPLQVAFSSIDRLPLEVAATLRAGPVDRFFSIILPQAAPGVLTAAVLGFVHTLGEFGVVLMIGGNIPGETRVVSVQIYDHVEAFDYAQAHGLAALLLLICFFSLLLIHSLNPRARSF